MLRRKVLSVLAKLSLNMCSAKLLADTHHLKPFEFYFYLFIHCVSVLSVAQLEAALGVFYAPPAPLSDMVILEYREPIRKYARRFFRHLLR